MVVWKVRGLADNCNEETRQASDSGYLTSLYEIVKLAYLEPDEKICSSIPIKWMGCGAFGYYVIAVDSSLFVFWEDCSSILLHLTLNDIIDETIWMPGGELLFLADRSGLLHCVHVKSKQVIFTKKLPITKSLDGRSVIFGKCFLISDSLVILILITSAGEIVRMENIERDQLCEAIKLRDVPFLSFLDSQMMVHVDLLEGLTFCADCVVGDSSYLWIWAGMEDQIRCWTSSDLHTTKPASFLLLKFETCLNLKLLLGGRYLAAVDKTNSLYVVSSHTGLVVWDAKLMMEKEVQILDMYELFCDVSSVQLLLSYVSHKDDGCCFLGILNIPSFQMVYEVSVAPNTCLLKFGDEINEIAFLEPEFKDKVYIKFKLKSIIEGEPGVRLANLLRKYKFKEAEEFCITFCLPEQEVYKAKSKYLISLGSPFGPGSQNSSILDSTSGIARYFDDLLLTLNQIDDSEFVATLCINAILADINLTERLLNYGRDRLAKITQTQESEKLSCLSREISKSLHCLQTFQNIFLSSDSQSWLAFSRSNMLKEFLHYLTMGDLDVASTIWHRHQFEFLQAVDEKCVSRILNSIPFTITCDRLCSWLTRIILRDLILFCPTSLETIASWADDRIRKFESFEKEQWPTNGCSFADALVKALDRVSDEFSSGGNIEIQMAVHLAQRKVHSTSSPLYCLRQTALALIDLKRLSEGFGIKISFSHYTQECKQSVVRALLDWLVSGEEVAPFLDGFLRAFMQQHYLDCDQTLAAYIQETLESCDHYWWEWEEAIWEDRLYSVAKVISDVQVRVKCIVMCIRVAPVPWSERTKAICIIGKALYTKYTLDLEYQEKMCKLKMVLRRHNLQRVDFSNIVNAELILRNITSKEGDGIFEDTMVVVDVFEHLKPADAYFFRVHFYMCNERSEEAKALLETLEESERATVCLRFVHYIRQHLTVPSRNDKGRERLKSLIDAFVGLENVFKVEHASIPRELWPTIRRIHSIQVLYDLCPTLDDLEDPKICSGLLGKYITGICARQKNRKNVDSSVTAVGVIKLRSADLASERSESLLELSKRNESAAEITAVSDHMTKLVHLSGLLGVSKVDLMALLVSFVSQNEMWDKTFELTRLLRTNHAANLVPAVYSIIQMVVNALKSDLCKKETISKIAEKTPIDAVNDILSTALVSCSSNSISMLAELGHWCLICQELYRQCNWNEAFNLANTWNDPFFKWTFGSCLSAHIIPIEESLVRSAVVSILTRGLMIYQNNADSSLVTSLPQLIQLLDHLKARNHNLLSLMVSQQSYICLMLETEDDLCSFNSGLNQQEILSLVMEILSSDHSDQSLATCLLTLLPAKESLRLLNDIVKRLGTDYRRLADAATIGRDFCMLHRLKDPSWQFSVLGKRATWGMRLQALDITFEGSISGDKKALLQILKQLVASDQCSLSMVSEFCEDFSWDIVDALSYYVSFCLQSWSPSVKELGKGVAQVPQSLLTKIDNILSQIDNKVVLQGLLEKELNNLPSYNYEMLEVVLSHLSALDLESDVASDLRRMKDILDFLKVYKRQRSPSQKEKEAWFQSCLDSRELPEVSQLRLPFHELCNKNKSFVMKIMEQELDVNSIDIWLKISDRLQLSSDEIYFTVAQNTLAGNFQKENISQASWQLCSANSTLLSCILAIVQEIKNPDLAVACANWISISLPSGVDQVEAARMCSILATQKKGESAAKKFRKKSNNLAVEHALYKYKLAEPKYLNLTSDPESLVYQLYHHPSLSILSILNLEDLPDINSCVKEICDAVGYNQTAVQLRVLQQWLPMAEGETPDEMDETVSNFKLIMDSTGLQEKTDAKFSFSRIIFLLRCVPQKQAVSYLLTEALSNSASSSRRLKAFRCLIAIGDPESIQEGGTVTMDEIRSSLQTMTYISRLESMGYATSVTQFKSIDKEVLAQGILRSLGHNTDALLLLVDLCCDFQIRLPSLWGSLLARLTSLVDLGKLDICIMERVLLLIKNIDHLWPLPQLAAAWQLVISHPFRKACLPLTDESLRSCTHSVNLLICHCPVNISIEPLLHFCEELGLPVLMLALMSRLRRSDTDPQEFLKLKSKESVKAQYESVKASLLLPKFLEIEATESLLPKRRHDLQTYDYMMRELELYKRKMFLALLPKIANKQPPESSTPPPIVQNHQKRTATPLHSESESNLEPPRSLQSAVRQSLRNRNVGGPGSTAKGKFRRGGKRGLIKAEQLKRGRGRGRPTNGVPSEQEIRRSNIGFRDVDSLVSSLTGSLRLEEFPTSNAEEDRNPSDFAEISSENRGISNNSLDLVALAELSMESRKKLFGEEWTKRKGSLDYRTGPLDGISGSIMKPRRLKPLDSDYLPTTQLELPHRLSQSFPERAFRSRKFPTPENWVPIQSKRKEDSKTARRLRRNSLERFSASASDDLSSGDDQQPHRPSSAPHSKDKAIRTDSPSLPLETPARANTPTLSKASASGGIRSQLIGGSLCDQPPVGSKTRQNSAVPPGPRKSFLESYPPKVPLVRNRSFIVSPAPSPGTPSESRGKSSRVRLQPIQKRSVP